MLLLTAFQDLETRGHTCKRCETQNVNHKLRFFALNHQMEVFKCESRKCMFPFRCFVFRDRRDQSYHTYKRSAPHAKPPNDSSNFEAIFDDFFSSNDPETPPTLTDLKSPAQYREESIAVKRQTGDGHHSDTSQIEDILNELFPTDTENPPDESLPSTSPEPFAEIQIPPPDPPKTLSRSLGFLSKLKAAQPTPTTCIQPKNIRSPLDLVKGLLQKTVTPVNHQLKVEPVKSPLKKPKGPQILNRSRRMDQSDSDDSVIKDTKPKKSLRKQSTISAGTSPLKSTRSNTILPDLSSPSMPIVDLEEEEADEKGTTTASPPKPPRRRSNM